MYFMDHAKSLDLYCGMFYNGAEWVNCKCLREWDASITIQYADLYLMCVFKSELQI